MRVTVLTLCNILLFVISTQTSITGTWYILNVRLALSLFYWKASATSLIKICIISDIYVTLLDKNEVAQVTPQFQRLVCGSIPGLSPPEWSLLANKTYANPSHISKGFVGYVSNHAPVQQSQLLNIHCGYSRVQFKGMDHWPNNMMAEMAHFSFYLGFIDKSLVYIRFNG